MSNAKMSVRTLSLKVYLFGSCMTICILGLEGLNELITNHCKIIKSTYEKNYFKNFGIVFFAHYYGM